MKILLTGGSACGKSTFAEELVACLPKPYYYIATMRPYGPDSLVKIAKHRKMRDTKGFTTIEKDVNLSEIVFPERGTVLLECLCNLTANEMFDDEGGEHDVYENIMAGIESVAQRCNDVVVVTNDVGSDLQGYSRETRDYIEMLGRINATVAQRVDRVYELVCGIPILIKGEDGGSAGGVRTVSMAACFEAGRI